MNEIFHWLIFLGLCGLGLWVLLIGVQFAAVIIGALSMGIFALVGWIKKQLNDDHLKDKEDSK